MNQSSGGIHFSEQQWAQMEADVAARAPEEACGFVIGLEQCAHKIIPVTNILHDTYRFRMDPQQELNGFLLAEKTSEEILAIYHSHPHGINQPSTSDLDELTFPGIIYLIWYKLSENWSCKAYLMHSSTRYTEIPLTVSPNLE